jgi:anti-sigma factor RsiW
MNSGRPINEDDLQAYVDNALDSRRRAEIEAWLAEHPQVAAQVSADLRVREVLREALLPIADEPLPANLSLERLVERRKYTSGWGFWRNGPMQAAAASLLIVMGGVGGWGLRSAQEPSRNGIAALAQEATDSYSVFARDVGRPVEIRAADSPQFVEWASRQLERPVSIPDLSFSGYTFIGGRVIPTPHGPAVLYMFDNDRGTRLTLLSRNMAVERDAPMSFDGRGAVTSVSWAQRGLGFSLVGPLDREVLHPIADAARAQLSGTT